MDGDGALEAALEDSQRLGMLGTRSIDEVVEHSRAFVRALDDVVGQVIDLGSGGGVPGLVIAWDRPDLRVVLLDRRTKRTDLLLRLVRRLGLADRVDVLAADALEVARRSEHAQRYDAVTSRGFGPPDVTVRAAAAFVRPGGLVVVSEPPPGQPDRWDPKVLAALAMERRPPTGGAVAVFRRRRT